MLTAYEPQYQDLWFKRKMLSDAATMSYNHAYGGTIAFPEERWGEWYEKWIADHSGKRYYRYLKDNRDAFVGEISYHYDADRSGYMADVIIFAPYRGNGYGREALDMLCLIAKENGIPALYDEIAIDNPSISLFLKQGFSEECRTQETILLVKNL